MQIFDAHLDLALNGVDWNRDLTLSVDEIRSEESRLGMGEEKGRCTNTVSFPELKKARISICLATLLARQEPEINHSFGWISPQTCYAMAHSHLAYYHAMEQAGYMRMLTTGQQLHEQFETYHNCPEDTPLGFILTMEGADPLLTVDTVSEFYQLGLRAIGLTHYGVNRYGGGTSTTEGLSNDAYPLLKRIEELGMTVDMTHLSDPGFWQVLENFGGRIHASHQNSRQLANWQRQFSDEQYAAVIQRGGVVGMALDIIMLQEGYERGVSARDATLSSVVENIDIVCQIAGNAQHVGIGSDLDGGYGSEQTPADLDRISDLQKLESMLQQRGYPEQDIASIFHGNWLRFFSEVLGE